MRNQQDGLNPCLNMLITVKNYPATRQRHKWIFRRQLLGYVAKTKLLQMADQVFEKKIKIKRNCNGLDDFGISIERLHVSLCLYINICGLLRRKHNLEKFLFFGLWDFSDGIVQGQANCSIEFRRRFQQVVLPLLCHREKAFGRLGSHLQSYGIGCWE